MTGDFHTHTLFCDGADSAADMCAAAYALGLSAFGLSGHCHTPFDVGYCMSPRDTERYIAAVNAEKQKYEGKMEVLLGLEADIFGKYEPERYDYVISSAHYVEKDGVILAVEDTPEIFDSAARLFDGDVYRLCERYYEQVSRIRTGIVGHFDVVTKFGRIDESDKRYRDAALAAADALLGRELVFEVNTTGLRRGLQRPYPARFILERIKERGGRVMLSSDAHSCADICAGFAEAAALLREIGFKTKTLPTVHGFVETEL